MSVYAISDLHLALSVDKPMNVFGNGWDNYMQRIEYNWNSTVNDGDIVIVGGDVSWSMYLDECKPDFDFLNRLTGKKIILKGNHDYWWESVTKLNRFIADNNYRNIEFMYNNSFVCENYALCGTRGWLIPSDERFKQTDRKMYDRELIRFNLSIDHMLKNAPDDNERIAIFHYPPFDKSGNFDENILSIFDKYNIKKCLYGHLHGKATQNAKNGEYNGVKYKLISSDYMKFELCNVNF